MIKFIKYVILPLWFTYMMVFMFENIVYYNPSVSEPLGYYLAIPGLKYQKGDVVLICIPDDKYKLVFNQLGLIDDGSCDNGLPHMLKTIAASKGDVIRVAESGIFINDKYQRNSAQFQEGNGVNLYPLPVGWSHKLKADEFFLLGNSLHSVDSRYFGIVTRKNVYRRAIFIFSNNKNLSVREAL